LWLFSVSLADLSMAFLLSRTAGYEATRPVDKVFALVGLSYDMSTSIINYSKSEALAAIQIEVALNSIKQDGTWDQCCSQASTQSDIPLTSHPGFQIGLGLLYITHHL
jgi:hypothetical protein